MVFLRKIKELIQLFICWAYIPFKKIIPVDTFSYAICGGSNLMLDTFLYFITYNFILKKRIIHLHIISISPYIASFIFVFPITFITGFLLMKHITFSNSNLRRRVQVFRYGLTVMVCIFLNYILLKFFVEYCKLYPTPSKMLTTVLVVVYSYFSQKHFTFKTVKSISISELSNQ